MPRITSWLTSCALALTVSVGLSVAWPAKSLAASVYTFTYSDNGSNPPWSASGSFSIPVADFTAATTSNTLFDVAPDPGVTLPNTDITAADLTVTTPYGSAVLGLSFVNSLGSNVFNVSGTLPQLVYGTTNFLVDSPTGCNPETSSTCTLGIQAATFGNSIIGFNGFGDATTDISGTWTTSLGAVATPLPAALPLFAGGLGVMGLLGWRRKRKASAAIAVA
jgi:hypothetical protein